MYAELTKLEAEGRPIRVGVSGAGWIGSGFVAQVAHIPGMRVSLVADTDLRMARHAFLATGVAPDKVAEVDKPGPAMDLMRSGNRVITGDYTLASQLDSIDIVADITPSPAIGAVTAHSCIMNKKPIVLVNIEADVTVGRILKKLAKEAGVLYTVSSGDEPGCLAELWDFVKSLGFEPMVIGKGKNNPLDCTANPDTVAESALRSNKDPFQVASYVDGTKTMFEMTCAANATGCRPMQRGMVGPQATLQNVSQIFALVEDGGITKFPGAVDFVQGNSMAGGVFITVRVEDTRIREDLEYLKVGKGKYYTFFRPYHLWFLEAPFSVAQAYLQQKVWMVPLDQPIAEVMTVAKMDLMPGQVLDDFGGYTYYGTMENAEIARQLNALPVGLAPKARIRQPVKAGEIVTWEHVALDEDSLVVSLRRQQDAL